MTPEPIPSAAPADEALATAQLVAFDAPTVPALATEQGTEALDSTAADDAVPEQPVMALYLRDLRAASQPPEPLIWPVPWRAEDAAPWWQRAWAHAQGAWIGTALAALLVLGLLGAGTALHLAPPRLSSTTTRTTPHPTATKTTITTTPLMAQPAPTVRPSQQPPATRSGSGGHGHKHK